MIQQIAENLAPSCEQVLETMFFTGILSSSDQPAAIDSDGIASVVTFEGPPDGRLCAGMTIETAAALASSFLGVAPDNLTTAESAQVASELANMLCGSVLSRSAPQNQFRLTTLPTAPGVDCAYLRDHGGRCTAFDLPEGRLCVSVQVQSS